jgi:hypothetical protein
MSVIKLQAHTRAAKCSVGRGVHHRRGRGGGIAAADDDEAQHKRRYIPPKGRG